MRRTPSCCSWRFANSSDSGISGVHSTSTGHLPPPVGKKAFVSAFQTETVTPKALVSSTSAGHPKRSRSASRSFCPAGRTNSAFLTAASPPPCRSGIRRVSSEAQAAKCSTYHWRASPWTVPALLSGLLIVVWVMGEWIKTLRVRNRRCGRRCNCRRGCR